MITREPVRQLKGVCGDIAELTDRGQRIDRQKQTFQPDWFARSAQQDHFTRAMRYRQEATEVVVRAEERKK